MGVERSCDKRGRITIPSELRDRYGERFRVVALEDGIKLVPIPADPIATLRESGSQALEDADVGALREAARRRGDDAVDEHVR